MAPPPSPHVGVPTHGFAKNSLSRSPIVDEAVVDVTADVVVLPGLATGCAEAMATISHFSYISCRFIKIYLQRQTKIIVNENCIKFLMSGYMDGYIDLVICMC